MTSDKLNGMLRSMSARLGGEPAHQPILHQLDILLHSLQPSLRDANLFGRLLVDAGLLDEAKEFYKEMTEHIPDEPQGFVGMAQVAMQRRMWQEALTWWDEVIARFGDKPAASWLGGRATALMELGRFEEAENIFHRLTRDFNDDSQGFVGLARLAMLRGLWTDALRLWDDVLTRFSGQTKLYWNYFRATTLVQLDRLDEAENIFRRLADDFPTQPQGFVGRAEVAARKRAWHEALVHWDEVIARFSRTANPSWQMARANALLQVGRADEAEAVSRQIIRSNPKSLNALLGLLQVLIAKGKPEQAAFELESSAFQSLEVVAVVEKRFRILLMLKHFSDARTEFDQILLKTNDPAMLNTLFAFTPSLHEPERRMAIWNTLLKKLDSLQALSNLGSAAFLALRARILLALRDYKRFLAVISGSTERDLDGRGLLAVASKLSGPSFPDYHAPKVFGVGLAKTGTSSLAAALTVLGFHTLHSFNPLTREMISEDDLLLFDAFTDAPVCSKFEKYYFMFPNSKFIYTVRPFESWKKSMSDHFLRVYGHSDFADLKVAMTPVAADVSDSFGLLSRNNSYEEAYDRYDQRVRRFFQDKPKDRFLEFDVFAGRWEELCAFTGRAIPSTAFPWLNRKP
jgi:tetratricopeptide (TPR) repeat protein